MLDDSDLISQWQTLTTRGTFAGDICRCPGDLTLALYDADDLLIGSATMHGERVSWERERFGNDLLVNDMVAIELLLATLGVKGSSKSLLGQMIAALDLDEGEAQFRPAGDAEALAAHRVPQAFAEELQHLSGMAAAGVDQAVIDRLIGQLRAARDEATAIRDLLIWLGTATWPTEAISGDGQLARRLLDKFDSAAVVRVLEEITDPVEVMGGLVWSAFLADDSQGMRALAPAIKQLLNKGFPAI